MNHPWPEKSQPTCPSSSRSEWDIMIARMKAQISNLSCSVRRVVCTYAWWKKEIVFWSIVWSFLWLLVYHWWPKILKVKHNRKDIKLLAAKKTTYIEVNTPSTNHIYNFFFGTIGWVTSRSPVTQKLSQVWKILRTWDQRQSQLF